MKYGPISCKFVLISQVSDPIIRCGFRSAAKTYLINLVKTPGAGDHPKGRP